MRAAGPVLLAAAALRRAAPAAGSAPVVTVAGVGTLRGAARGGTDAFLGVPYAAPPVGALRFRPAAPAPAWGGVRDAVRFGAACVQDTPPDAGVAMGEDCLTLNVWRPAAAREGGTPVLVWIHGGGMQGGGSAKRWFDGARLAAAQRAVVVTLNYRVGPLGFLAREDLRAESGEGNGGANGIADQLAALRWVHEHIQAFGGDPERVTLFGESAGALSACVLMLSPRAAGLFDQVILESGPCIGPWGPYDEAAGVRVSAAGVVIGGTAAGNMSLAQLRAAPAADLQWSDAAAADPQFPGYFVDGDGGVVPQRPAELLARGAARPRRAVVGFNSKDGLAPFNMGDLKVMRSNASADWAEAMEKRWANSLGNRPLFAPADIVAIQERYALSKYAGDALHSFVQSDSDYNVACPTLDLARQLAGTTDVRVYQFADGPKCNDVATIMDLPGRFPLPGETGYGWASHTAELPFVFGVEVGPAPWPHCDRTVNCTFSAAERASSDTLQGLWGAFARREPLPEEWPRYGAGNTTVLRLTTAGKTAPLAEYMQDTCRWWRARTPLS